MKAVKIKGNRYAEALAVHTLYSVKTECSTKAVTTAPQERISTTQPQQKEGE